MSVFTSSLAEHYARTAEERVVEQGWSARSWVSEKGAIHLSLELPPKKLEEMRHSNHWRMPEVPNPNYRAHRSWVGPHRMLATKTRFG